MTGHWRPDPTSWRSAPRPKGWKKIRQRILQRDNGRCTWVGASEQVGGVFEAGGSFQTRALKCDAPATDVDHIGDPSDHSDANLRSLCGQHHRSRTARQAGTASAARRTALRQQPKPRHPGLITRPSRL